MRGVLHHGQPMPARDVQDRVHIARVAVQVNGQDGLDRGVGRHRSLDKRRVDVQRVGLDVDQDWLRPDMLDDVDAGGEGHRGADDLVAETDAKRGERHMQRRRARVEG